MSEELQGILARTIPYEEWHGKTAWAEHCPQCGEGEAERIREMPREAWGNRLGAHDTIEHIITLAGDCGHFWHALVGTDERRVLFYFLELEEMGWGHG
jgi:hypothetical protein